MHRQRSFAVFILIISAILSMPLAAQAGCDPALDYLAKARLGVSAGNYSTAIEAYDCALALEPGDARIRLERGFAGLMLPNFDEQGYVDVDTALNDDADLVYEALDELGAAIADDPENVYLRTARAYLNYWLVDDVAALADYEVILEADPDNLFGLFYRGSSSQYLGDSETAAADFARAVELAPDNARLISFIGYTYNGTDEHALAIDYFTDAIALEPHNGEFFAARARAHQALGDSEAASADAAQALRLSPTDPQLRENVGWMHLENNNFPEAIRLFISAITYDPEMRFSFLGLGTAMTAQGNTRGGAQNFLAYVNQIETESLDAALEDGSVTLEMAVGRVYRIPFEADAGTVIDINLSSPDGVDTMMILFDPAGIPLVGNDDPITDGSALDAALESVELRRAGEYVLLVTHAGAGSFGQVDVTVTGLE